VAAWVNIYLLQSFEFALTAISQRVWIASRVDYAPKDWKLLKIAQSCFIKSFGGVVACTAFIWFEMRI